MVDYKIPTLKNTINGRSPMREGWEKARKPATCWLRQREKKRGPHTLPGSPDSDAGALNAL